MFPRRLYCCILATSWILTFLLFSLHFIVFLKWDFDLTIGLDLLAVVEVFCRASRVVRHHRWRVLSLRFVLHAAFIAFWGPWVASGCWVHGSSRILNIMQHSQRISLWADSLTFVLKWFPCRWFFSLLAGWCLLLLARSQVTICTGIVTVSLVYLVVLIKFCGDHTRDWVFLADVEGQLLFLDGDLGLMLLDYKRFLLLRIGNFFGF